MKTLVAIIGIAILFVVVTDPVKEKSHASIEPRPIVQESEIAKGILSVNAAIEKLVESIDLVTESQASQSQLVATQAEQLVKLKARLEQVEKARLVSSSKDEEVVPSPEPAPVKPPVYPAVSSSSGGGSSGGVAKVSYGSSGSSAVSHSYPAVAQVASYGSAGSPVQSSRPRAQAVPFQRVAAIVTSPIARAGHWTYPGEIGNHLASDHGVAVEGMSREQMLDLHDALHEGTVAGAGVPSPARPPLSRAARLSQDCPGGTCPTNQGWYLGKVFGKR